MPKKYRLPLSNEYNIPVPITPAWYNKVYLTSAYWRRYRRPRYLESVDYRCEYAGCTQRQDLQIHHLSYDRLFHERDDDLMAFCPYHHWFMHELPKAANDNEPHWPTASNENKQMSFCFWVPPQKRKII